MTRLAMKYQVIRYTKGCSLNADRLPNNLGAVVHGWFEAGENDRTIRDKLHALGLQHSQRAIASHRSRHLIAWDPEMPTLEPNGQLGLPPGRRDHLSILEGMIARGASQLEHSSTKVGPDLLLKALQMYRDMTDNKDINPLLEALLDDEEAEAEPGYAVRQ